MSYSPDQFQFDSPHAEWFFSKVHHFPRFAHHPPCDCYDNHVLRIGPWILCLGCTCLAAGIVIAFSGLIVLAANRLIPALLQDAVWSSSLGVGLYLPTLPQPFFQWKPFKMASRFLLGIAIIVLAFTILYVVPWTLVGCAWKLAMSVVFYLVLMQTLEFRRRFTPDPSRSCDAGCYPFCQGNRQRLSAVLEQLTIRVDDPGNPFVVFAEQLVAKNGDVEIVASTGPLVVDKMPPQQA
jgi:hypothetical protein